jgi:hypothetical protein
MCDVRSGVDADSRELMRVIGPLLSASTVDEISCPPRRPAGQGRPVAKRAVVSFERGEHHAALVRLMVVR